MKEDRMINSKQGLLLGFILLACLGANAVLARDVSHEQYMVTVAQKEYDAAKAAYDSASQQVSAQKKKLAQEQAQLDQKQQLQTAAKTQLNKKKAELDQQLKALDRAWDKGR
jgi:hypothetical protein